MKINKTKLKNLLTKYFKNEEPLCDMPISVVKDLIYFCGVSCDKVKYGYHSGFEKFCEEVGVKFYNTKSRVPSSCKASTKEGDK